MKKKTLTAATAISLILVSLVAGVLVVDVAKANPYSYFYTFIDPIPGTIPPTITVFSPQNNTTCNSNITISFNVSTPISPTGYYDIMQITYTLDNNITQLSHEQFTFSQSFNLSEGNHSLVVYSRAAFLPGNMTVFYLDSSSNVFFIVDTTPPSPTPTSSPTQQPTISILSPLNDSFFNVSLGGVNYQLTYETNSTLSWVGYSIDGSDNVTVTGNSTFVHEFVSSTGYHTLTVYANDTSGNWAIPQSVTYLVNFYPDYTPTPSPSIPEFPTWIILPLAMISALLSVFALKSKKKILTNC